MCFLGGWKEGIRTWKVKKIQQQSKISFSLTERWAKYEVIRQLEFLIFTVNQATFTEASGPIHQQLQSGLHLNMVKQKARAWIHGLDEDHEDSDSFLLFVMYAKCSITLLQSFLMAIIYFFTSETVVWWFVSKRVHIFVYCDIVYTFLVCVFIVFFILKQV